MTTWSKKARRLLFGRIRGGGIDDNLFADLIPDLVVIWMRSIFLNLTLDLKAIQDASLQSSMYHQHQLSGDTPNDWSACVIANLFPYRLQSCTTV